LLIHLLTTGGTPVTSYDDIMFEVSDGIGTLTLNRPEVLNALRPETSREILDVLDRVRSDSSTRCLVITGAGRAFCAGDDFQAVFLNEGAQDENVRRQIKRIEGGDASLEQIFALEKPTIAAVNGAAVGYGMDLSLYCDIRIASEQAKFGWFYIKRAVVGSMGGTYLLRQLVGLSKAFELTLTGDLVDAAEAHRIGLVRDVVPEDRLMGATYELAQKLAAGPPLAQRAVKRAIHKGLEIDWRTLAEYQQALGDVLWSTEDHKEGVRSFVERRPPRFEGH
jgi:enoyl-CoA hydratase/carnithine racemase